MLACYTFGQPTVDEDLTDVERLTNKLELLTDTVVDLNMQLKQVWQLWSGIFFISEV